MGDCVAVKRIFGVLKFIVGGFGRCGDTREEHSLGSDFRAAAGGFKDDYEFKAAG